MSSEQKLQNLESFNWHELEDAYGEADNAPINLQMLASEDKEVRQEGLDQLSFTIYHQGTIYSSSVAAMTVLHEILQLEKPKEKGETFEMLALLVSGTSYHDVHQHLEYLQETSKSDEWQDAITEELSWVQAIRKSANENIDLYLSFLQNKLTENRLAASHLIAYLRDVKEKSLPAIFAAIKNETDEEVMANLYITAECLVGKDDIGFFAEAWKNETDLLCKMLGLRPHLLWSGENSSQEEYNALQEMLFQSDEQIISKYKNLPSAGDFYETFTTPLVRAKKDESETLLKWYLQQAKGKKTFWTDFGVGLFNVAFGGVPEQPIEFNQLSPLQKEAVIVVAKGAFPEPTHNIGWIIDVLEYYKFPRTYEKICEYLGKPLY